jgi:hypothetical protein
MLISADRKFLYNRRSANERSLDRTEVMIMELLRQGIDPTDYIKYRETLRSRAYDISQELKELRDE